MEKLSYNSYPDSAGSSPRSREIDFENPPPWEEHQSYKAKFMCSYGGKIQPRPHDNQLAYVGGETKILSVDRGVKFSDMVAKLSVLSSYAGSGGDYSGVTFKYQLPGEDLDALISVTNDDDLEHMMHEYDRIQRGSAKPARMRLFLFPVVSPAAGFGSESATRTESERFVGGHSSAARAETEKPIAAAGTSHVDFLFGLEKSIPPPASTPPPTTFPQQVHVAPQYAVVGADESDRLSDHGVNAMEMQNKLREFQRLQIVDQDTRHHHHQAVNLVESGGFYQKFPENRPAESVQHAPPPPVGYWPDKHASAGAFHAPTTGFSQQQVYVLPSDAQGNLYHYAPPPHAPPQSLSGQQQQQPGQGYYNVNVHQRVSPDVYNAAANPTADVKLPVRHVAEQVYGHVVYDGSGRQVYYTAPVGGVVLPPSQVHPYGSRGDGGGGGGVVVSQEGRVASGIGAHVVSSSN